ncbi:MAG TPA: hypothetical protein VNI54_05665 [Thermoanaerobaculia bacterium]|nr:hypothetical protein [Thermoanaerobaculia bacterium]
MPLRALVVALLVLVPVSAQAARSYHLELEANPAAAFPYLGRFGSVDLHVYASGVRGDLLWLKGLSKNGASAVTVANPLARMYVDVPVGDIAPILQKMAGTVDAMQRMTPPARGPSVAGQVLGVAATRHRLIYGPEAWIDYWTTGVVPENAQFRRIAQQFVAGISPATAEMVKTIPGTPVYIELNFRRFKKVPLLKLEKLSWDVDPEDEKDALELGPIYMRAPLLDKVLSGN